MKFYTIQFIDPEGQPPEIEKFFMKLSRDIINKEELDVIQASIEEIGRRGANDNYFNREENNAFALPPYQYFISSEDYGVRLYCLRLSKSLVFLLNGDRKKTKSAQNEKSNVSRFFRQANSLYNELLTGYHQGFISWDSKGNLNYPHDDYYVDVKG